MAGPGTGDGTPTPGPVQRTDRAEIITDNTLIRIAVDLLLDQGEYLANDTEAEFLCSARAGAPEPPEVASPGGAARRRVTAACGRR
ncbi:hypothetical protein GCM10010327_70190 [Streptomyces nitrosporeus]|nr:hypothetical protein GCM10010327_70190 [Streptomyces nitrosporeus]